MRSLRLPLAVAALAIGAPLAAQSTPPSAPPPAGPAMQAWAPEGGPHGPGGMRGHGGHDGMMPMMGFEALSPDGRKIMIDAMRSAGESGKATHEQVKAAREKVLAVLEADRLDVTALKRAMDEEQAAVNAQRDRMQAAMIGGFSKLSLADRRSFVAYSRAMKNRMEARMEKWREMRGQGGPDMPPPPPPRP
jgi:uncharacterized membrane protein